MVDNFPGGISVFDKDLKMVLCNEQQKELLEYPPDLFTNGYRRWKRSTGFNAERGEYGPGDIEAHVRLRMDLARQQRAHVFERTRPNGKMLEIRGVPLAGGGFVTTYLDVTEQRRNQAMVAHMAHHDSLTELPNRVLFGDRLDRQSHARRRGEAMAVHYLDLDRFKPVNDEFGHAVGDGLLMAVAERLNRCKRETDTAARLGGDEFVFIQVGDLAPARRRGVRQPGSGIDHSKRFIINGNTIEIGTSIGISLAPDHGLDPEDLLKKADTALYRANPRAAGSLFYR